MSRRHVLSLFIPRLGAVVNSPRHAHGRWARSERNCSTWVSRNSECAVHQPSVAPLSNIASANMTVVVPRRSMSLFRFLDHVWNRVDSKRIEEIGAEMAAAEWVLRCGGSVKWSQADKWIKDYNQLEASLASGRRSTIEAIDGTDSCIMDEGFGHLKNLRGVKKMVLKKAYGINDVALNKLQSLQDTLEELEIVSCGDVTDAGIRNLDTLVNLKRLNLADLPGVKNPDGVVSYLQKHLPNCQITFHKSPQ